MNALKLSRAEGVMAPMKTYSRDYFTDFHNMLLTGIPSAALYEQAGPNDFPVPSFVDGKIVPLAVDAGAVRSLASVIVTTADIHFPIIATSTTVALKPELGIFREVTPLLGGFTLSAFQSGVAMPLSFEVAQDIPAFTNELKVDFVPAQNACEENFFLQGTGVGQPQGMIGNTGVGVLEPVDGAGNLVTIQGTENILDTLPSRYHPNAAWLMNRSTARIIRAAQRQQNLVQPVWTRENGQDYLHGYPVAFSESVPDAAPGSVPLLFGDFGSGYLIGDRFGSEICMKVLDQARAAEGVVEVLIYRRCDGRIRRSEAIQQYRCAS